MIIIETLVSENRERRYSDEGFKIRQIETGNIYEDAVDVIPCPYTYEETDEPIDSEPIEPQAALDMIFGGEN